MKEPLDEAIDNCHADPGQFKIIKDLLEKEIVPVSVGFQGFS